MPIDLIRIGMREWRTRSRELLDRVRTLRTTQVELTNNSRADARLVNPKWAALLAEIGDDQFDGRAGELYALLNKSEAVDAPLVLHLTRADADVVLAVFERFARLYDHELIGGHVDVRRNVFARLIAKAEQRAATHD